MESPPFCVGTQDLHVEISKYESLIQWLEALESEDDEQECNKVNFEIGADEEKQAQDKILLNRLGGKYSTGRPLPMETREKIVELAKTGLKPCQISKELRVSHGCVSKLLTKWRKTGTVKPEKIGGSRPKKVLPVVSNAIVYYKNWRPLLQSWQIKELLIKDSICTANNVPSVSSINKTLRNKLCATTSEPPPSVLASLSCCVVSQAEHIDNKPSNISPPENSSTCMYSYTSNNTLTPPIAIMDSVNAVNFGNQPVWNDYPQPQPQTRICPIENIFSFEMENFSTESTDDENKIAQRLFSSSSACSFNSSSSSSALSSVCSPSTSDYGSMSTYNSDYNDLLSFFEDAVFD